MYTVEKLVAAIKRTMSAFEVKKVLESELQMEIVYDEKDIAILQDFTSKLGVKDNER